MTKEELKKEAIQYAIDYPTSYGNGYKHKDLRIAYLAGAEQREKRITELEKENAELKEVHERDKRSLALIAKKGADFEKAYNEAEELLDKQIEATYKVFEENKELKEKLGDVQMQKAGEKSDLVWKLKTANEQKSSQLTYAKTIIQDLLDNTDEYARQRAEDFLKENK